MLLRNNTTLVGSYDDLYTKWTTLRQERDQAVPEFTNIFHTLCTKLGIKDSERHLVLKYHGALHRYIQPKWNFWTSRPWAQPTDMCQNRAEAQTKDVTIWAWEPSQQKPGKGSPNPQNKGQRKDGQYQDNQSKPQAKKDTERQRKILGSGVTSIRSLGITLLTVAQSSRWWLK
jgi:hypothetical protein